MSYSRRRDGHLRGFPPPGARTPPGRDSCLSLRESRPPREILKRGEEQVMAELDRQLDRIFGD